MKIKKYILLLLREKNIISTYENNIKNINGKQMRKK